MREEVDMAVSVVLVTEDGKERLLGRIAITRPDVALVDALGRMQLYARRCGGQLRLRDAPDPLRGLLSLTGLAGTLGLEPGRQAELGEEGRADEVVQPPDPAA